MVSNLKPKTLLSSFLPSVSYWIVINLGYSTAFWPSISPDDFVVNSPWQLRPWNPEPKLWRSKSLSFLGKVKNQMLRKLMFFLKPCLETKWVSWILAIYHQFSYISRHDSYRAYLGRRRLARWGRCRRGDPWSCGATRCQADRRWRWTRRPRPVVADHKGNTAAVV